MSTTNVIQKVDEIKGTLEEINAKGGKLKKEKVKDFFLNAWTSKSDILPKWQDITPKISRLNLTSNWIWIIGTGLYFLLLVKILSPLVISSSLFPVILPAGILAGLYGGINDFFGLFTAIKAISVDFSSGAKDLFTIFVGVASKLGYALTTISIFVLGLTFQSIYRVSHFIDSALFKRDIKSSIKELLAITNPLLTFFLANFFILPWLMGTKGFVIAVVTIFIGPEIATAFNISGDISVIVNGLAKAARGALISVMLLHLSFVGAVYVMLYKLQCKIVDMVLSENSVQIIKDRFLFLVKECKTAIFVSMIVFVFLFGAVSCISNDMQERRVNGIVKISCNKGYTEIQTGNGENWLLKGSSGKGVCFSLDQQEYLSLGQDFYVDNVKYKSLVIKSVTSTCEYNRGGGTYVCKKNYEFPHDSIFWVKQK
jgi:hypothetical protein